MMPNVFPMYGLNGELISRPAQRFLADGANYRIGAVRFRTIRVKDNLCKVPESLHKAPEGWGEDFEDDDEYTPPIDACYPTYNYVDKDYLEPEAGDTFMPMKKYNNESKLCFKVRCDQRDGTTATAPVSPPPFTPPTSTPQYRKDTNQPVYTSTVTGITYSGNGYVIDLGVEEDPDDPGRCNLEELYDDEGYISPTPGPTAFAPSPDPSIYPTPYPTMKPTGYKTDM